MNDLSNLITDLSGKNITRKQFLAMLAGGFLSMFGIFRFLQEVSTPRSVGDQGAAFGQSSYGGDLERNLQHRS
jgi:hypothetical protein